jgi:Putative methyltransferase
VTDWVNWHREYDDPASSISARLIRVRVHLADAIDRVPAGPVRVLSLCAGQGHDVLGVLPGHPRRDDVTALLVEADPVNADVARRRAAASGLAQVRVRQGDASLIAGFADALPADVLLLCGIFGNVSDADIRQSVLTAPSLCADGATVIWTRHRRPPDLTVAVRSWFAEAGFDEVAFDALDTDKLTGVGAHQLRPRPASRPAHGELRSGRLFTFQR